MSYIKLFVRKLCNHIVMMVAMDIKFGRIYCAISDVRNFLYFQLPHNFTDHNETYGI